MWSIVKYFLLSPNGGPSDGVAIAPEEIDTIEVTSLFVDDRVVCNWKTLELQLEDGEHTDLQANDLALRICSSKLRAILEENKHANDKFQWLPVRVSGRDYHVLHLPETVAISKSRSLYHDDILIAPVIAKEVRAGVFKRVPDNSFELIVSARVRATLLESTCTGMDFEEVAAER